MRLRLLYIIILGCTAFVVKGQHHFFRQYSLEQGLPQSEVNDIAEDKFGYLWLGTNGGGLCRFNGIDFEVMTKKNGLLEDIIMGLYSDNNYNLWVGSQRGISKYDGQKFKHVIQSDTALFQERMQFIETIDGNIWALVREVGGNRSIYQITNDSIVNFTQLHADIFKDKRIFFATKAGSNKLMVSTNKGVFQIEGNQVKAADLKSRYGLSEGIHVPLLYDKFRNLWILSFERDKQGELLQLKFDGSIQKVEWPSHVPLNRVFRIYEDRSGGVWMAVTSSGVVCYKNNEVRFFSASNGLKTSLVTSFGEDREGNMWLGTSGSGLFKYGGDLFVAFNRQSGLGGDIVRAIFQDSKGNFYLGDDNNTISIFDGESVKNIEKTEGVEIGQARKFIELSNDRLLIGALNGLFEYDHNTFKDVSSRYGLNQQMPIIDLLQDNGDLWVAIYGLGLLKYEKSGRSQWYNPENSGLSSPFISNLFIDSNKNLWISTTNGAYKFDGNVFTHFSDKEELNAAWVLQVAEDKVGNIWLATFTGGLNRFDGTDFQYYDTSRGVKSDNIYSVLADAEGNIWAGTQNGVDKITIGANGEVSSIHNFDKDDGFIGIENNGGCNLLDRDGRLWFGTIKGAMVYNPNAEKLNYLEPPVYITEVLLNFKDPEWKEEVEGVRFDSIMPWFQIPENLSLAHYRNHVSFQFDGLCYTVPEKVRYKWKLEPIEEDWSPENKYNKAFYPSLRPGNYTFRVKACNNDGVWNEEGIVYSFEISPAWYQYAWVKILGFIIVFGLVVLMLRSRIRKERKMKYALEEILANNKIEIQKQQAEIIRKTDTLQKQKEQLQAQAESLQGSNKDLERLTKIGQLVAANLSVDKISELLYQSLSKVMSADIFSIGLYNSDEKSIDFSYSYLRGERQPFTRYLIEDKERLAIYCFTHVQEVFVNDFYKEYTNYISEIRPVPEGAESESVIYIPLKTSRDVVGVISVQSLKKGAYTNYHLNFLQNIANYASIALGNALMYQNLVDEQKTLQDKHEHVLVEKDALDLQRQQLEELNNEKNKLFALFVKGIQEPLNMAIGQMTTFLSQSSNCTPEQLEFLGELMYILKQQNEVVGKVLEVRNIEMDFYEYQPQEFELIEAIQEVVCVLEQEAVKKQININVSGKAIKVNLDLSLLVKIVENLLSNAIRYSPNNKSIQIIVTTFNGKVRIEVHDEGPGLTEQEQEKIFEKYIKLNKDTEKEIKSSGLGLYIVKKYVTIMNGEISCESISGFGASFIVQFPL
ncbi:GAF domain-containing protein [Labilibacter sediminis]|nr:GAF domain-containing protein [Labilibacter sediminis]